MTLITGKKVLLLCYFCCDTYRFTQEVIFLTGNLRYLTTFTSELSSSLWLLFFSFMVLKRQSMECLVRYFCARLFFKCCFTVKLTFTIWVSCTEILFLNNIFFNLLWETFSDIWASTGPRLWYVASSWKQVYLIYAFHDNGYNLQEQSDNLWNMFFSLKYKLGK